MSKGIFIETNMMLMAAFWGMVLCFFYDVLRIFRRIIPRGVLLTGVEDILCWCVAAIVMFRFIYEENGGVIRAYLVFFMIVGMVLWEMAFGRWIVYYAAVCWQWTRKKILKNIARVLKKNVKPFTIPYTEKNKNLIDQRGADDEKESKG